MILQSQEILKGEKERKGENSVIPALFHLILLLHEKQN